MRIRIVFSKTGSLRYIGHLDLHQVWERTVRRAGLPLAYTQGFHPSPRIQLASALPLGFIGWEEVVDIWLDVKDTEDTFPNYCRALIQDNAPPGLTILSIEVIDDRAPALQTRVIAAEYQVLLIEQQLEFDLEKRVNELLVKTSILRERRGKPYDLRPLIQSMECQDASLIIVMTALEGATGRPEEVLSEMGIPVEMTRIERMRLIFRDVVA